MKAIIKNLPFAGVIALNVLSEASMHSLEAMKPFVLIINIILILNLLLAMKMKISTYFMFGLTGVAVLGGISVLVFPLLGEIYLHNIIVGLYLGLFIVAAFPPLFKMKPFTFEFSVKDYPKAITEGQQFLKINLIINYIWVFLFAVAIVLTKVQYSSDSGIQMIASTVVPILLQVIIGIPLTLKLPKILMQKVKGEQLHFTSIKKLFQAMPYGLNAKKAEGLDELIQFKLSGKEPTNGYLQIKNKECTYTEGIAENPKTTIISNSELWLKISNNEVSGDAAFMNKEYSVEGDASILLNLGSLFSPENDQPAPEIKQPVNTTLEYKTFEPKRIKKVIVLDGGPRSEKLSKTTFMVNNFCKGLQEAGAEIEFIKLKNKKINPCSGCYQCWTQTPGECIYKDDMTELRIKLREADLVIYSSPLYIFNVTGIMKNFLDRLLPNMKPYMLIKNGQTQHPHRYEEDKGQGFVVFSASGFPEVEHNFDGLKYSFRCFSSHMEKTSLMGEFFLPAAESIVYPVYKKRRDKIAEICETAGKQIVNEGKIDVDLMMAITNIGFSKETFQSQADNFWKTLDGKKSYLKEAPKF
ncbi:MAG: NAD(P)H-dependent oxidoreductase [Candidatus Cloacimonetes bacterium]|nr:NAD(P)H-dependent oxidoreductase [Candidatus Cloacimonadota bacterium]